jgi:hypothetical protein
MKDTLFNDIFLTYVNIYVTYKTTLSQIIYDNEQELLFVKQSDLNYFRLAVFCESPHVKDLRYAELKLPKAINILIL